MELLSDCAISSPIIFGSAPFDYLVRCGITKVSEIFSDHYKQRFEQLPAATHRHVLSQIKQHQDAVAVVMDDDGEELTLGSIFDSNISVKSSSQTNYVHCLRILGWSDISASFCGDKRWKVLKDAQISNPQKGDSAQ